MCLSRPLQGRYGRNGSKDAVCVTVSVAAAAAAAVPAGSQLLATDAMRQQYSLAAPSVCLSCYAPVSSASHPLACAAAMKQHRTQHDSC